MDAALEAQVIRSPKDFTTDDIILAAAINSGFYGKFFFPKTCRQETPLFHAEIDDVLERPENRYVALEAFRGSAKTSKLRLFTSKRIAYGTSRTILFISASEGHATKSLHWLKQNVVHNTLWAQAFKLSKGHKWTESDIEIYHGVMDVTIRIIATGMTGQVRGLNIDDYRPDLIIVDDPEDEENTATDEQREKISNLFFGAVQKSLAPSSENPEAKLAMLQTPLHRDCLIEMLMRDPSFVSRKYGCFNQMGESRWNERFPTEELLADKEAHIARNKLSLWLREMECKLASPETSAFRPEWLRFYDILPEDMTTYMAIDPAPVYSDKALLKNWNRDFQAVVVIGIAGRNIYLLEYANVRNQNPDDLGAEIVRMIGLYKPRSIGVETHAYQQTLKWYLNKLLKQHNIPRFIREIKDRRKKSKRIIDTISDLAYNGRIFVKKEHTVFIDQFVDYPHVSFDDVIDAFSMTLMLMGDAMYIGGENYEQDTAGALSKSWQGAP